ncbi:hypothetical protein [Draconibacterium mangrovi]|uniref:hypothetical protein n=1 Tax=Draconibacterium mangrovi TaxID=2697469 RepID=UPI0013D7EF61|nr:hypothetical protein [Draconibacterium mangrovi]
MKHTSVILLFALLFSCSTTGKLTDEVFKSTLIGKSEMEIYARLGQPAKTVPIADGGKEMIYEFYGRDISLVPDKSPVVINSPGAQTRYRTQNWNNSTLTTSPDYSAYNRNVTYLKVLFDKTGKSYRFEQNLSREQQEMFYESFKRCLPDTNN